jgi:CelD/BcsL family acetyltransferase involved in cellulose biosynthesis
VRETRVNKEAAAVALEIESHAGLPARIDEVAEVADPRHLFLRRAWFAASASDGVATLVASRADGRAIAALPTCRAKPGLRAVPGSYWPFRSFPIAADASDAEIVAFLSHPTTRRVLGRAWRLGPVFADDPTALRLTQLAARSGWSVLQRHLGTAYSLDIAEEKKTGPWPRPSTLKNIAKQEKRLARSGTVGWRHVAGDGWCAEVFDALALIERNSWVGNRSGADPKFLDGARRKAWETAVADPVLAQALTAGILSVDGEPICFSFGIDAGGTRYSIATSYDQRYAKLSAGYLTGYRTYVDAAENGVEVLNLGIGDSGAKGSMGAQPQPDMVDCLIVRGPLVAALARPLWQRSGSAGDRRA